MDINDIMVDILEAGKQIYFVTAMKPFLTVSKVERESRNGGNGNGTGECISFTIDNESCHDLEVQELWFLTSYNRQVHSPLLSSGLPLKLPENGREVCSVPVAELRPALNRHVGETINRVVVLDSNGRQSVGRVKPEAQVLLAG